MLSSRLSHILTTMLGFLALEAACVCGPGPNVGGYDDPSGKDPPRSLQGVKFVESEKGEPGIVGCADGQREGFADLTRHKRIAGCLATWEGTKSLRDKPTGKVCGDDNKVVCNSPADACAKGWHLCGWNGKNDDIKRHTTPNACNKETGPGKFVGAMSHGQSEDLCPPAPTAETVFPCMDSGICSEPVCCGDGCQFGKCRDGVWKGQTKISLGKAEGCGSVTSERNGGVLCCFDGDGDPGPAAAPDTKADVPAIPTDPGAPVPNPTPTDPSTAVAPVPSTTPPSTLGGPPPVLTKPADDPTKVEPKKAPKKKAPETP